MTNRMADEPYNAPLEVRALVMLRQAGWSVGDFALRSDDGRLVCAVTGSNGENLIRVKGVTKAEAWGRAVESARSLGMLGRSGNESTEGGDKKPLNPHPDPRLR